MTTKRLRRVWLLAALSWVAPLPGRHTLAQAQATPPPATTRADTAHAPQPGDSTKKPAGRVDKTFFTRRDAILSAIAVGGTLAIAPFDEPIARWAQSPGVQGGDGRHSTVDWLTRINETPLTLGAIATYGVGRLGGFETVTDIGLHMTEALVLTDIISEAIRGPIGRSRPRVANDNAFSFHFWGGFTHFDERSFPSLHSSSAFAAASSLAAEIRHRNPRAARYTTPILYAAALVPGLTRVYLNQHWASDIAAGAFIGTLLGNKVVRYAHSHEKNRLDRILTDAVVVPRSDGGVMAVVVLAWPR